MLKTTVNEQENGNQKKEKNLGRKGESQDVWEKAPVENSTKVALPSSLELNLDLLEERRKSLSEEHEKLLANNRALQEEVFRLKSKLDKLKFASQIHLTKLTLMEELKSKIKDVIPEEKHIEIDKIFEEWVSSLKVHTVLSDNDSARPKSKEPFGEELEEKKTEKEKEPRQGKSPLKSQIEELKKQIETFKQKMKTYKDSGSASTSMALKEVKEEIGRVREGIVRMRENFASSEDGETDVVNAELIKKLDEVKQFLEKLK